MNGVDGGSRDVVLISGLSGSCEAAKQDLLAQVPIQEVIDVPFEFHGTLIGRSGKGIRDLQSAFEVSIVIPEQRLHSNQITVAGPPQNVHDAVRAIKEKVEEFERQARDRELKNFELVVRIPPEYHAKIVGPKGVAIGKIRTKHEVQIEMPGGREGRQGNRFQQQQQRRQEEDEIIIRGYEENATKCKEELERMVSDWEGQFTMDISLDSRIHNRLIGQKGKNIRKIMDDYKVEIKLPRNGDPDPNLVKISGKDEEQVYDCVDHLRNMEEEYLQDMTEDYNYRYIRTEEPAVRSTTEVSFTNAPWSQAPDTSNIDEFPAMGAPINGTANGPIVPPVVAPAWGRRH